MSSTRTDTNVSGSAIAADALPDGRPDPPNDQSAALKRRHEELECTNEEQSTSETEREAVELANLKKMKVGPGEEDGAVAVATAGKAVGLTGDAPPMPPIGPTGDAPPMPPIGPTGDAPAMPPIGPTGDAPPMPPIGPTGDAPPMPPIVVSGGDAWRSRFDELRLYKERHGNCNVPRSSSEHPKLGAWVNTQRKNYKKLKDGKKSQITQERVDELESLGFVWDTLEEAWRLRLEDLREYKEKYGDYNVPRRNKEHSKLGKWVNTQRTEYKKFKEGKNSQITQERVGALKSMGFVWDSLEVAWRLRFDELCEYKESHGHCNVPKRNGDNKELGRWVDNQRVEHKKLTGGKKTGMTQERIELLENLGFQWKVR